MDSLTLSHEGNSMSLVFILSTVLWDSYLAASLKRRLTPRISEQGDPRSLISFTQPWGHSHSGYPFYENTLLQEAWLLFLEAGSITMDNILKCADFAAIKCAKNYLFFNQTQIFSSKKRVRAWTRS